MEQNARLRRDRSGSACSNGARAHDGARSLAMPVGYTAFCEFAGLDPDTLTDDEPDE